MTDVIKVNFGENVRNYLETAKGGSLKHHYESFIHSSGVNQITGLPLIAATLDEVSMAYSCAIDDLLRGSDRSFVYGQLKITREKLVDLMSVPGFFNVIKENTDVLLSWTRHNRNVTGLLKKLST